MVSELIKLAKPPLQLNPFFRCKVIGVKSPGPAGLKPCIELSADKNELTITTLP